LPRVLLATTPAETAETAETVRLTRRVGDLAVADRQASVGRGVGGLTFVPHVAHRGAQSLDLVEHRLVVHRCTVPR